MKLNKKKVFALALAVCLIATLSFGTLAWFTDDDSVTNDFMIAGSENEKPDEIFSVDVWEDDEPEDPENDEKHDKLEFKEILPGDALYKEANVENTGSYDQYIRVKITVSDAAVWQDVYEANMVPVTEFVNLDRTDVYGIGSYLEGDNFAYYVYYKSKLAPDAVMNVFTEAYVSEHLTQAQAAKLTKDGFQISVKADAVQTRNVGDDVYAAFKTVGMEIPVNTAYANDKAELIAAFADEAMDYIVLNQDITNCYAADRILGTSAELYLNDHYLDTAYAEFNNVYGVVMTGDLAISGYGTFEAGSMKVMVDSLTVYGGTIVNDNGDRIVDTNGDPIVLP